MFVLSFEILLLSSRNTGLAMARTKRAANELLKIKAVLLALEPFRAALKAMTFSNRSFSSLCNDLPCFIE